MEVSDWINVILCILSFILAVISVITVIITLKQNSKMIKNSTRPYVVVYKNITYLNKNYIDCSSYVSYVLDKQEL